MPADRSVPGPHRLSPHAGTTLLDYMQEATERFMTRPAYSQQGQTLTFLQLAQLSEQFASFLQSRPELKVGDRVAVQLPNILSYPIVAFGVLKAGMILVNVNPLYTAYETSKQLQDADVKAWICVETSAHLLAEVSALVPIPLRIVTGIFDFHRFPERQLYSLILRRYRKLVKPYAREGTWSLHACLRAARGRPWQRPELRAEDIAMLQYTGGTTGVLKGAMLSHGNIIANIEQIHHFLGREVHDGSEIVIAPLPIYHIFSFTVHCATPLITGAHNVLVTDPTQIPALIREMRRWPFTSLSGVNTLYYSLLKSNSFKQLDFRSLRFAIAGGMKLDPQVGEAWQALTGRPILEGFGMTELSPVASFNPPHANRLGTIGKALPDTELRLVDDAEQTIVTPHTPGELWVRGPQVMQGYWRQAEETAKHLTPDGWMRTGDRATFDTDGYWRIVGRSKRMILVSGFNVYPQEIEEVLRQHPAVEACRVLGVSHPVSGEVVKIIVATQDKNLKVHEIREHCRRYLTSYKLPKQVLIVDKLPSEGQDSATA